MVYIYYHYSLESVCIVLLEHWKLDKLTGVLSLYQKRRVNQQVQN